MRNYLGCIIGVIVIIAGLAACTAGLEIPSSPEINPATVSFVCQSPVQVSSSSNVSIVGCVSGGAIGYESQSANAIIYSPLQILGSTLLGE